MDSVVVGKEKGRRAGDVRLAERFVEARRAIDEAGRGYHRGSAARKILKLREARRNAERAEYELLVRLLAREMETDDGEAASVLGLWLHAARAGNNMEKKTEWDGEKKR